MTLKQKFAEILYNEMKTDSSIYFLTGDLGFRLWDNIKNEFPDRYYNVGASEQLLLGAGVGLALKNKIPILYSITPFLLYRPFEWIRNYLDYESIPVKIVGSGRDKDYAHDGISHWAYDDMTFMSRFENIVTYRPDIIEQVEGCFKEMLHNNKPTYINLSTK